MATPQELAAADAVDMGAMAVLLIGREAQALAGSPKLAKAAVSVAANMLEAVFAAGKMAPCGLVIADIAEELAHLEAAVRSLRRVNASARIVLLCEPVDEAVCRRAMGWGADDYLILPLDAGGVAEIFESDAPVRRASSSAILGPDMPAKTWPGLDLLDDVAGSRAGLPLAIQTALLEEVFEGAGIRPDFANRAVTSLKRSLHMNGTLRFVADEADATAKDIGELRQKVAFAGQLPFGILVWEHDTFRPSDAALLQQAGNWLAAMLAVSRRYEQLRTMAITDELSGAYNRRYFMPKLTQIMKEARDNRSRVTLLLFDIDDFKKYNDTFGHASGDAIIRELIKILNACTRPYDLVARIGGDEFAVVYRDNEAPRQPNSEHPKDVLAATERFREAIRNHQWPQTCNIKGNVSISGGLATFPWDGESMEQLFAKADEALLRAKAGGKNVILLTNKSVEAASA